MWNRFKRFLDVAGTVLIVIAAGALSWRVYQHSPPALRTPVQNVDGLTIDLRSVTHVRGDGDVVLVEFADYECPFCVRHAQTTAATIKTRLIDSGKLQHIFFHFPLPNHPHAQKAAEAAECAARQGRFWDMSEQLFVNPQALAESDLLTRADELDFERATFVECLQSGAAAGRVRADMLEGRRLGVNSTPAFFVGVRRADGAIELVKRINGAAPFEVFNGAVQELSQRERLAQR